MTKEIPPDFYSGVEDYEDEIECVEVEAYERTVIDYKPIGG